MTQLMVAKAASQSLWGSKLTPYLSRIASGICFYFSNILTGPKVTSSNTVLGPGYGQYVGKIVGLVPSLMSTSMVASAIPSNIYGRDLKRLFDAVSFGVCTTLLTTVLVKGNVIGGGPGVGFGKLINLNPISLQKAIQINLTGLYGSKSSYVASAIAKGICLHITTFGNITTTCVGFTAPPPAGPIVLVVPGPGYLI